MIEQSLLGLGEHIEVIVAISIASSVDPTGILGRPVLVTRTIGEGALSSLIIAIIRPASLTSKIREVGALIVLLLALTDGTRSSLLG